jgi:predicted dehydrogenase
MEKTRGIGLVGLGFGKQVLAINADADSALEVRGICARRSAATAEVQAQHRIPFATTDYAQLLARPDIDIIGIFTPDAYHYEQILAALAAGKHVIVTKPMVVSSAQAEDVVRAVERSGRKLLVGQTSRWQPQNMAIKAFIDEGALGDILIAEGAYVQDLRPVYNWSPWRYTLPQDYLYGGAIHLIDLLRWFAGEIEEVTCYAAPSRTDPRYPADMPDNFLINARFAGGPLGRILCACGVVAPPMPVQDNLSIFGTRGSVVDGRIVLDKLQNKPTLTLTFPQDQPGGSVVRYLKHFEACLRDDTTPLVDEREGARGVAVVEACWASLRGGGRPVRVGAAS